MREKQKRSKKKDSKEYRTEVKEEEGVKEEKDSNKMYAKREEGNTFTMVWMLCSIFTLTSIPPSPSSFSLFSFSPLVSSHSHTLSFFLPPYLSFPDLRDLINDEASDGHPLHADSL